ncbi:MAG: zinc-binding dehydrogenase, partial [Planctomycetota bacterium]
DGVGLQGAQADYVRVPLADSTLLALPQEVHWEQGLLLGDVLPTAYFCAELAEIRPGNHCVVVGCGPVGILAVRAARELGAEQIFAVDTVPERLALAARCGAVPISLNHEDPVAVVGESTEGQGCDAVLEAVGSRFATELALDLVRPGGILAVVGVHSKTYSLSPKQLYDKNLTFKIGRCPARHYMERLLPLVQSQKLDATCVISHRLPLEEGAHGYQIFAGKREGCTKVLLRP